MLPVLKIQSESDAAQAAIPFTAGHVFLPGDMPVGKGLVARLNDGAYIPLQVDVKVAHADGSVLHAILSGLLPALAARDTEALQLIVADTRNDAFTGAQSPPISVHATVDGVAYSATDSGGRFIQEWLAGFAVSELQTVMPLTAADGTAHPHLTARFARRMYSGTSAARSEVVIENNWAYVPGPRNFVYDAAVFIADDLVSTITGLTHRSHARWRETYWTGDEPLINIQHDASYEMAVKAVPNYGRTQPNEKVLQQLGAVALSAGPMTIGAATAYMPTTGAHEDIGILPMWQVSWLLSGDSRARDASLVTGDGAGSFSMHYRDQITDRPVSLVNFPYMTIDGRSTDTGNPATGKQEAFPVPSGDISSPYTADTAHHPSLAYLPYLRTGDFYYLEELQFYANFNLFKSNPGYRGAGQGLFVSEQLRGQAWAIRTLAQAAYITPDADPQKASFVQFMANNLGWYNATYTNNTVRGAVTAGDVDFNPDHLGNDLGGVMNGYSVDYNGNTGVAPWMDDFFTQAIGYSVGLGFADALPLLAWKSKFTVGRMTAPGVCWVTGAPYELPVRATSNGPYFKTLAECYAAEFGDAFMALPCASPQMAVAWTNTMQYTYGAVPGDMGNISTGYMGYPSNMQPALAYCAEYDLPGAKLAWDRLMARSIKCDYSFGGGFNVEPSNYTAQPIAPYVDPDIALGWNQIATENQSATVPDNTIVRYGSSPNWIEKVCSGIVTASNAFFGTDPAPTITKVLQQYTPPPTQGTTMTTNVSIALAIGPQTLPATTEAAATFNRVQIRDADGVTVLATIDNGPYDFPGITAGPKVLYAVGIDSNGAELGTPYTADFTVPDDAATTHVVQLPSGATFTFTPEQ